MIKQELVLDSNHAVPNCISDLISKPTNAWESTVQSQIHQTLSMSANKFKQEVTPGSYASATYPSATYPSANASAPSKPSSGGQVHYEIETSGGQPGVVVYEVHEVYIYIPAELSAAGFELKICGVVRITDKVHILNGGRGYSMEISSRIV